MSSNNISKSTKINGVFYYLKRDNNKLYTLLKSSDNTNLFKQTLLKEIDFYSNIPTYSPRNISQIINNIGKHKEKYGVDNINQCILCTKKRVHTIEYRENIIYMTPGKAINNSVYFVCQHFLIELDNCLKNTERFSIVFNFDEYTFGRMLTDMSIAMNLSTILKECYYERLDTIYLIDSPSYLSPMLLMMEKMFNDSIYNKMERIDTSVIIHRNVNSE
jgi:hypothetical protein